MAPVRLTQLSNCAGCAAKLRPDVLGALLKGLPVVKDRRALVGFESSDDAAVFDLGKGRCVVQTADFFPPVVDEPYAFGEIAAANALSDIWAMGARPLFALNLVAFPKTLPLRVLKEILRGGAAKAKEAGIPILGGHTIQSPEPKYGMAVTGEVDARHILRNTGARAGDILVLTKPIGTGIATTALKRGFATRALARQVTAQMATLNKPAGEVFASRRFPVHALTDVTGFGLLGHLGELVRGAGIGAELWLGAVPLLPGVAQLAEQDVVPGGTRTNLDHARRFVRFPKAVDLPVRHVLADAQTNGGLLAALPERSLARAIPALEKAGVLAALIGRFKRGPARIEVTV